MLKHWLTALLLVSALMSIIALRVAHSNAEKTVYPCICEVEK